MDHKDPLGLGGLGFTYSHSSNAPPNSTSPSHSPFPHRTDQEPQEQPDTIMSSHNDPNPIDEEAEQAEIQRIRQRFQDSTARVPPISSASPPRSISQHTTANYNPLLGPTASFPPPNNPLQATRATSASLLDRAAASLGLQVANTGADNALPAAARNIGRPVGGVSQVPQSAFKNPFLGPIPQTQPQGQAGALPSDFRALGAMVPGSLVSSIGTSVMPPIPENSRMAGSLTGAVSSSRTDTTPQKFSGDAPARGRRVGFRQAVSSMDGNIDDDDDYEDEDEDEDEERSFGPSHNAHGRQQHHIARTGRGRGRGVFPGHNASMVPDPRRPSGLPPSRSYEPDTEEADTEDESTSTRHFQGGTIDPRNLSSTALGGLNIGNVGHRGRGAPSPLTRQSPLPDNGQWGQSQGSVRNPFAGRAMDDNESSADEAPAPPRAANALSGRGRGNTTSRGSHNFRGRGRGRGQHPSINDGQSLNDAPSAPGLHVPGARQASISQPTASMTGLGIPSGHIEHPNNREPIPISAPAPGPQIGSLDGRAVYETTNGISIQPPPQPSTSAAPPPKSKANARLEQLRIQAAAQMEAIQRQLKEAEDAALAEEAEQMDLDGAEGGAKKLVDDIGDVNDWSDGGVADYDEDSEYEYAMQVAKGAKGNKGKKKEKRGGGIMEAMKVAAQAMRLPQNDPLDEGATDRQSNIEFDQNRASEAKHVDIDEIFEASTTDDDVDEYEADYLPQEDEDGQGQGEAMAREAQRLLEQNARQPPPFDPNIDPTLQLQDLPRVGAFFNAVPPQFRHAESHYDIDNPPNTDDEEIDSDELFRQQDSDGDIAMGEDSHQYDEYDSEWEEDPIGYDDEAALAALGRPAANVKDTYAALDAFGIQANPSMLAFGLKRKFGDDDPDLIVPQISNFEAPRKKVRGPAGRLSSLTRGSHSLRPLANTQRSSSSFANR